MNGKQLYRWFVCLAGCFVAALTGCNALSDSAGDTTAGSPLPNDVPIASVREIAPAILGEIVRFDASDSADSDGEVVSFDWDFGDGASSDLPVVEHVFDEAGEYTVTLTVTDNQGAMATNIFTVVVFDAFRSTATLVIRIDPENAGSVVLDPLGSLYEVDTMVTLSAMPANGFRFEAFIDNAGNTVSVDSGYILTIESDTELIAQFVPSVSGMFKVSLAVSPTEGGHVALTPTGSEFEAGMTVSLAATPNTGYEFVRFSGDISSANSEASFLVDSDKSILAEFALKSVVISLSIDPSGTGLVIVDPIGGVYDYGTSLTITPIAASGFVFDRFVNNEGSTLSTQSPFELLASKDLTIIARFVIAPAPTFAIGVTVVPQGGGSVILDPSGGVYEQGTVVTITATSTAGYGFLQYSGDASGTDTVLSVTMDADKSVSADFQWNPSIGNPGNLLVTGFVGKNVSEFDRFDGSLFGEVVASESGGLSFAAGIDVGPDGNIYVVNVGILNNTSVLRYDGSTGDFIDMFIDGGDTIGFFTLRFGPNGNLFVPDTNDNSIQEYDGTSGVLVREFVSPGAGGLDTPFGLRFGPNGNLFVASKDSNSVIEFDGNTGATVGTYADLASVGFEVPVDLVFNQAGDMFVAVSGDDSVVRVDATSGDITAFVVSGGGNLDSPGGILFHPDNGNLLVVSQGTNEVLEYNAATGEFLGIFAKGAADDSFIFMAFRPK